ncbi:MAG TPA: hypothetical protein VKU35_04530 [Candidatus Limnocylindria bacterium]|nr:hypothetical protein [Candidatus Limnocylindria bacterium]
MTERRRDVLAIGPLVLAALVLGHDLTYLLTYGPDYQTALLRTGHRGAWTVAVVTVALLTVALVVLAGRRLATLAREARENGRSTRGARGRVADLLGELIGLWALVLFGAAVLFVINENVERAANHLPLTGIRVLAGSAGNLLPLLVLTLASGLVAAVAALYRWRRDVLVARLRAARAHWSRAASHRRPRPWPSLPQPHATVARLLAGRDPPRRALLGSPC